MSRQECTAESGEKEKRLAASGWLRGVDLSTVLLCILRRRVFLHGCHHPSQLGDARNSRMGRPKQGWGAGGAAGLDLF